MKFTTGMGPVGISTPMSSKFNSIQLRFHFYPAIRSGQRTFVGRCCKNFCLLLEQNFFEHYKHASLLSMSAIQKINNSGLSSEEKDNLKALIGINVEIKNQIFEDDQVTDTLLRKYLQGIFMSV